jgi:hypothetical protein
VTPSAIIDSFFTPGTVNLLAGLIGACGSMALAVAALHYREKLRDARGDKKPVATKLLRPAGFTVGRELDDLTDQIITRLLAFAASGALAALAGTATLRLAVNVIRAKPGWDQLLELAIEHVLWVLPLFFMLSMMTWVGLAIWSWRAFQRQADLRLGYRGETAVGEALNHRKVMKVALAIYHDIPGDGAWNIDHIVVTNAGIFMIETKTRTKRAGRHSVETDVVECQGEVIRFPYWNDERTVLQTDHNARWLRQFVNTQGLADFPIHAVIALPGWNVRNPERLKIPAMNANGVVQHIASTVSQNASPLDESRLRPLLDALDERCRTVDF